METVMITLLFSILAVLVFTVWVVTDKLDNIDKGIRGLFPWLEMIKRETEYTNPLVNKLIEYTKSIFDLLEKKQKDGETAKDIKRKISNDYDEAVRERIETLKNMDTKDNNPLSPKFTYLVNEKIKEIAKAIEDTEDNQKSCFPPISTQIKDAIKEAVKQKTERFRKDKLVYDTILSKLPGFRDNFSFKAMQSLGDAGKFMLVKVPPGGEGNPIMIELLIQNGPIKQYGEHGMQVTDVLQWVRNMYILLNKKFPCKENRETINHIDIALGWQKERTSRREKEGIEGYNKEIVNEPTQTEVDEIMECLSSFGEAREFTAENNYEGLKEYLNGTTEPTQTINEDLNESE